MVTKLKKIKSKTEKLLEITKTFSEECSNLKTKLIEENKNIEFAYNPLDYAWTSHKTYLEKYGDLGATKIIMGMNPGHGMGNTGIPFGCPEKVKNYLEIKDLKIDKPERMHPKRLVTGLECEKPEISGKRIWGLIEEMYGTPDKAFQNIFVLNHFPLWMFNQNGQNITPDKLSISSSKLIFETCNRYLIDIVDVMNAKRIICVGKYANRMARKAIKNFNALNLTIDEIPHPSPANPLANKEKGALWKKIAREVIEKT